MRRSKQHTVTRALRNMLSRVAQEYFVAQNVFFFYQFLVRAPRLTRARRVLIFHPFHFLSTLLLYFILLAVMNNHLIHAQHDGLVDRPHKVFLHYFVRQCCARSMSTCHWQTWEKRLWSHDMPP